VASDHSPCPPDLKRLDDGDFLAAWGGISSLQLALPVVWTEASARGRTLAELAGWMAAAPARLVGLAGRKGAIAAGRDADLVLFDPDAVFRVEAAGLQHRHPVTPYAGRMLHGVVLATWLRGRKVYDGGRFAEPPLGTLLRREEAA
jgi:allantoinase